jgi:hypothetical protein
MDASWLPASKQQMIEVFKLAWLQAENESSRNWVEVGWDLLAWFQEGVGETPINIKIPKDTPLMQYAELSKRHDKWLRLVFAEAEPLALERERFKKAPRPRVKRGSDIKN